MAKKKSNEEFIIKYLDESIALDKYFSGLMKSDIESLGENKESIKNIQLFIYNTIKSSSLTKEIKEYILGPIAKDKIEFSNIKEEFKEFCIYLNSKHDVFTISKEINEKEYGSKTFNVKINSTKIQTYAYQFCQGKFPEKYPDITVVRGINWARFLIILSGTLLGIGLCMLTPYIGGGVATAATFIGFGARAATIGAFVSNSVFALNAVRIMISVIGAVLGFFGACAFVERFKGDLIYERFVLHKSDCYNDCEKESKNRKNTIPDNIISEYEQLSFIDRLFLFKGIKEEYRNKSNEKTYGFIYTNSRF